MNAWITVPSRYGGIYNFDGTPLCGNPIETAMYGRDRPADGLDGRLAARLECPAKLARVEMTDEGLIEL